MVIYHEASKDSVDSLLRNGLKCDTSGAKSDAIIHKLDAFLDKYIPQKLEEAGVSRSCCSYGYLGQDRYVIDIKTGQRIPLHTLTSKQDTQLFRVHVDEKSCFVSDLNSYDEIKTRLQKGVRLTHLDAHTYWSKVITLSEFTIGSIKRPEVLIPHNIAPKHLEVVND